MNWSPECIANMGKWVSEQQIMLEQEMIEAKGKEMAREIDREILWGMLEGIGWHRVMLPTLGDAYMAVEIMTWLEQNCKKAYERSGRDFIFESTKDANWFKLRWGTV
jgi:hypothetical protein